MNDIDEMVKLTEGGIEAIARDMLISSFLEAMHRDNVAFTLPETPAVKQWFADLAAMVVQPNAIDIVLP